MTTESMNRALLRNGALLFLLGLLTGLAAPAMTNPRAGLSAHLEGVLNGIFLLVVGALWSRLELPARVTTAAYWLLTYGTFVNWIGTLLSAVLGTSKATPIAGAGHAGAPWQESLVFAILGSVAVSMIVGTGLLIYGFGRKSTAARLK